MLLLLLPVHSMSQAQSSVFPLSSAGLLCADPQAEVQRPQSLHLCSGAKTSVFAPEQILQMVPQCDYLVCCTPYTPDTHQLVSAAAIAAMKPTAVFINVGRGKCVDEEALVQGACRDRRCLLWVGHWGFGFQGGR